MHSKLKKKKRILHLFWVFCEAGDGFEKAKANQLTYLLPEQPACEINKM